MSLEVLSTPHGTLGTEMVRITYKLVKGLAFNSTRYIRNFE